MVIDGMKLIKARYEKGWSTTQASKKAGIGRMTLYRLENNITTKVSALTLKKLSLIYGHNVEEFTKEGE